jgi:hypothetical protein
MHYSWFGLGHRVGIMGAYVDRERLSEDYKAEKTHAESPCHTSKPEFQGIFALLYWFPNYHGPFFFRESRFVQTHGSLKTKGNGKTQEYGRCKGRETKN